MNNALFKYQRNNYVTIKPSTYITNNLLEKKTPIQKKSKCSLTLCKSEISTTNIYLNEIYRTELLTADEEQKYALLNTKGDQAARDILIKCNFRFVVKIAYLYVNRGVSFLDLIQEGNLGLMQAVDKFDPEKGNRLTTYAIYWIREAIDRAIMNQSNTVRIPIHIFKEVKQYKKANLELTRILTHQPSHQETADYMGLSLDKIEQIIVFEVQSNPVYMENSDHEDVNQISDSVQYEPSMNLHENNMRQDIINSVFELPEKLQEVICRRFGMCGYEEQTLDEIATEFNLTKERIRQLQVIAIDKLKSILEKHNLTLESLIDYSH